VRTGRRPSGGVSITETAALRRRLDHRDVAEAGEAHLQGARDRRRRHRQDVDFQFDLAQQLLLFDPEALLLVDDHEAEVLRPHVAREQPVGADQDVDLALLEVLEDGFGLGGGAQAGDALDPEGEVGHPLAEGAPVLLGEDRRRHQHHHLESVGGGLHGGPQRHLGLAEADVAADKAVHRPLRFHVALDRFDRLDLVGGLAVGEIRLELDLPLAVGGEGVAFARFALGVEVQQFARQRPGRFARPRLQVLPAFAAQGGERRFAPRADVAAQFRQLFGGDEDAVLAFVFEVEVVAGDATDLARLEAGEAGDAVVLVDDVVADPELGEGEPAPAAGAGRGRLLGAPAAVDEAAEGIDGEFQLGGDEALAQARLGEGERRVGAEPAAFEDADLDPVEAVAGALRLPHVVEGDDGSVAGADQFLQLRLGLLDRAGGALGAGGAEGLGLVVVADGGQRERGARVQRPGDVDVEAAGVLVLHRGDRVLPDVAQGGLDLLGGGEDDGGVVGDKVERGAELVQREELSEVGRAAFAFGRLEGGERGELAVVGVELGSGCQLDHLGLAEAALGEGREPAHRLDLVAEELDPHGAVLGRRVDVEDAAADGELAALLDLLGAFVAGGDEVLGDGPEVDLVPLGDFEARRAQGGVRHGLGEGDGGGDDDRVGFARERVEGIDAEADEVRRRGDAGGVAGAAGGVEPDPAGGEEGAQVGGEVTSGAVVGGDQERRTPREPAIVLEQRREQQRPQRRRSAQRDALAPVGGGEHATRERVNALVLGG
jgi:hypothetical protein